MSKGITGHQMAIILGIIISLVGIVLFILVMKVGTEGVTRMFGKLVAMFLNTIRGILGGWSIFLPGL